MEYQVITVTCPSDLSELLMAELAETGFDSFLENEEGFEASVETQHYNESAVLQVLSPYMEGGAVNYHIKEAAKENWNKLWESNYPMVEINDRCLVRAPFHVAEKPYEYELIITPKMSFGTGHHATTSLMVSALMQIDCKGKSVLDAGSGTGILAIMALKLGAISADACDIEDWAVENALENAAENQVSVQVKLGTTQETFAHEQYDIILANINKNVLFEEIPLYARMLLPNSYLLLSGFYQADIEELSQKATSHGLIYQKHLVKDNWASIILKK